MHCIFHANPSIITPHIKASNTLEKQSSLSIYECNFTWAGNKAGLLHLLLNLLPKFVSTKLLLYWLRRRFRPVAPVDDTGQVPSPKALTTLCTLHKCTHKIGRKEEIPCRNIYLVWFALTSILCTLDSFTYLIYFMIKGSLWSFWPHVLPTLAWLFVYLMQAQEDRQMKKRLDLKY